MMRALLIAAVACVALGLSDDARAQFGGDRRGAWCLFYDPWTYNCGFATLEQCVTTRHGVGGRCQPSPWPPVIEAPARRKKRGRQGS
jgi:hypothetical protein